jgi:nascent polypeptide-associated complex subunit alpha
MFPGGVNPKQMGQMMKRFGIKNEELDVKEITMTLKNGKKLLFEEPQVQMIEMQGNKTYTIAGDAKEISGVPQEDIDMVKEQTGASESEVKKALQETNGDIAAAIMKLKKN